MCTLCILEVRRCCCCKTDLFCLVGCWGMVVWNHVLGVFYACVIYFCICTSSAQLSIFHVENHCRYAIIRNTIITASLGSVVGLVGPVSVYRVWVNSGGLSCETRVVIGSVVGLVGPVSVDCVWVRWQLASEWQHVQLSYSSDTLRYASMVPGSQDIVLHLVGWLDA